VAVDSSYRASFRIGRLQLQRLEVRISNFAESDSEVALQQIEVTEGEFAIKGNGLELAQITIKPDNCDWLLSLEASPTILPPGVYFVDFKTKKEGQPRWQHLKVADKHGLSESRLVFCTNPECAEAVNAWGRLNNLGLYCLLPKDGGHKAQKEFFPKLKRHLQRMNEVASLNVYLYLGNDDHHILESLLDGLERKGLCFNLFRCFSYRG
jgi:hypothetical protein